MRPSNPDPRTPENSRKVASNFSKHSNPSDFSQRSLGSKGGVAPASLRASSFEQKENERDPNSIKPVRVRSPAMPSPKGVKNFMAPTISASSKAIVASPKKRILMDRNEVARSSLTSASSLTSVSDSLESVEMEEVVSKSGVGSGAQTHPDASKMSRISSGGGGFKEIGPKSQLGLCAEEMLGSMKSRNADLEVKDHHAVSPSPAIAANVSMVSSGEKGPKSETGFVVPEILGSAEARKVGLEAKSHRSLSPSPAIAPLDADPSLPPYDPKTNYLSPRPRFLRYKPNPRIEHYVNKEGDLSESFSSECSDDTAGHTEEAGFSSPTKDSEEQSFPSAVEVEVVPTYDPEAKPKSQPKHQPKVNHMRSGSALKSKSVPLLLVLVIACLFIPFSDSPIISSSSIPKPPALWVLQDPYIREHLTAFNVNLQQLASRLRHRSINSFAYHSTVPSSPSREELGSFYLANLTGSAIDQGENIEYGFIEPKPSYEHITQGSQIGEAPNEIVEQGSIQVMEMEEEKVSAGAKEDTEYEAEKTLSQPLEGVKEDDADFPAEKFEVEVRKIVKEEDGLGECEMSKTKDNVMEETEQNGSIHGIGTQKNTEVKNVEESDAPHDHVNELEEVESQEDNTNFGFPSQIQHSGLAEIYSESSDESQISSDLKPEEFAIYGLESKLSMPVVLGILSAVIALLTSLVFFYMKPKQTPVLAAQGKLPSKKVIARSVSGSSESYRQTRGSPYQNSPVDVEMLGDSGPSEFSSSLNNSSSLSQHRMKRGKGEEALSHERRLRRDSVVSSSSISYGSFTTYEKLSAKKGSQDEEVMTPVRRSSRIRSQITSP